MPNMTQEHQAHMPQIDMRDAGASGPPAQGVGLRVDIQALRGIAVLFVLLFHAGIGGFQAGYLGVDIFFVISGYLITGLVARDMRAGRFSFRSFYIRRLRRLYPALLTVVTVSAALSALFLTELELREFVETALGSVGFSSNIVLWGQAGYFGGAAKLKPLLHMWSLSLEEQYYVVAPLALLLIPARFWTAAFALAVLASFGLCIYLTPSSPSAAFYLLPTRAWELGIGSLAALAFDRPEIRARLRPLFWPAVAVMLATPALAPMSWLASASAGGRTMAFFTHPGADALLACLATAVVILARHPAPARMRSARALARAGDFSYSLYLVHWPLFAFLHNAYMMTDEPLWLRVVLLGLSLVLGWLLWRFVEEPLRHRPIRPNLKGFGLFAAASAAVVLFALGMAELRRGDVDYAQMRRANMGLSPACENAGAFAPRDACATGPQPTALLWGDSYAMHLAPGLAADGVAFRQATQSLCGPFEGLGPIKDAESQRERWARGCMNFNDEVLAWLAQAPWIETVILSSQMEVYVRPGAEAAIRGPDGAVTIGPLDHETLIAAAGRMADRVRAMGKKAVWVGPPPSAGIDMALCQERRLSGLVLLGPGAAMDCRIPEALSLSEGAPVLSTLEDISARTGLPLVRLEPYLCADGICPTLEDGDLIYRDRGHFSYVGSRRAFTEHGLGSRILSAAR